MRVIRNAMEGVRNLLYYLPVVWRDRPWDQSFMFSLLARKLGQMEARFDSDDCPVVRGPAEAQNVRLCRLICERLANDDSPLWVPDGEYSDWTLKRWASSDSEMESLALLTSKLSKHALHWWD